MKITDITFTFGRLEDHMMRKIFYITDQNRVACTISEVVSQVGFKSPYGVVIGTLTFEQVECIFRLRNSAIRKQNRIEAKQDRAMFVRSLFNSMSKIYGKEDAALMITAAMKSKLI